jgi:HlyD family secretion protein
MIGRRRAFLYAEPNMDVPRKDAAKKRLIKRIIIGLVILVALVTVGYFVGIPFIFAGKLKPAAPGVELSTLWPDTVRRGPMVREVRGLGTLVPEDTLLIPANTDGRIEKILIRPGTPVKPDSIILTMTNPELQTALLDAEYTLKAAQAAYTDLRVTLEKQGLDLQATAAQVSADYHTAQLKAERDEALVKEGLVAPVDAKISDVTAKELSTRNDIEEKRLSINQESVEAQLAAQRVKVEQLQSQYKLKLEQVEKLKVRAGTEGTLQALPETQKVEEGQKVLAGVALAKVAQPWHLKAELKIAETQAKDVTIGQPAVIDTRNGLVNGHVSRIDPAVLNGTVTVDCKLEGALPQGARPDLSVDGTVELERLNDVVYMGRPVFGQAESKVSVFKIEPDGKYANRIQVALGRASVNTIEVREGLKVGDRVILSDMSAWDAYERIKLN